MQRRGANMMVEIGQTLASGASLDVTNDVLTALNARCRRSNDRSGRPADSRRAAKPQ